MPKDKRFGNFSVACLGYVLTEFGKCFCAGAFNANSVIYGCLIFVVGSRSYVMFARGMPASVVVIVGKDIEAD